MRETRIARVSFFLDEKRIYEMKKRERDRRTFRNRRISKISRLSRDLIVILE